MILKTLACIIKGISKMSGHREMCTKLEACQLCNMEDIIPVINMFDTFLEDAGKQGRLI